jgi:hypothetical protein
MFNGRWVVITGFLVGVAMFATGVHADDASKTVGGGLSSVALSNVMRCAQGLTGLELPAVPEVKVFHCENSHSSALAVCQTSN